MVKVISNHHFSKDVCLEIENKKLKWIVDKKVLNPNDNFTELLYRIFCFTACPDSLTNDGDMRTQDIINLIYSQSIEKDVDFIYRDVVFYREYGKYGENRESLDIVKFKKKIDEKSFYHYSPFPNEINEIIIKHGQINYGDVFSLFGEKISDGVYEYYDYPDSVWLILEYVEPSYLSQKLKIPLTFEISPTKEYIYFYYTR